MPRTSSVEAPVVSDEEDFEVRSMELAEFTVSFEIYRADIDNSHLFRGLPNDQCQCPHWGVVMEGKLVFHYSDHDEVYEAGDAYYAPPGHTPEIFAGGRVVAFSPTGELNVAMAVVDRNLASAQATHPDSGGCEPI